MRQIAVNVDPNYDEKGPRNRLRISTEKGEPTRSFLNKPLEFQPLNGAKYGAACKILLQTQVQQQKELQMSAKVGHSISVFLLVLFD